MRILNKEQDLYLDNGTFTVDATATGDKAATITFAEGGFDDAPIAVGAMVALPTTARFGETTFRNSAGTANTLPSNTGMQVCVYVTTLEAGLTALKVAWWAIGLKGRKPILAR